MDKNKAGQKWRVFAFNTTTNQEVTGDAANITAKLSKDYAAAAALADVNPTETEDGYYLFDLTKAETNADDLAIYPESSTADVQVIGVPGSYRTQDTSTTAAVTTTDGDVPFDLVGPAISVSLLPSVISVDESGSIRAGVGSLARVRVTCNQDVSAKTLLLTVETLSKTDVASVADASITKETAYAFFYLTSAMTTSERTLRWSLVNTDTGEAMASGLMFVTYDAQGDA